MKEWSKTPPRRAGNAYTRAHKYGISFYDQGSVLALTLDLSLPRDTKGAAGLDDVIQSIEGEARLEGRIGDTVRAAIMRAGRVVDLDLKVEARELVRYRMLELGTPERGPVEAQG